MASGEPRKEWVISQVSWTDWTAQDVYYWQEHSFQYAENINTDDEMHGIKLTQAATHVSYFAKCQLVSCGGNWVMALPLDPDTWSLAPRIFDHNSFSTGWTATTIPTLPDTDWDVCPWVVFQDNFWYWAKTGDGDNALAVINNTWAWTWTYIVPIDHPDYTDESISTPVPVWERVGMEWTITAILNYNNTRLVVACTWWVGQRTAIWVYYPELDQWPTTWDAYAGATWWKKVLEYEAWTTVVALTCTFEYLKVWCVDEWWNTKVYYYQGNNNLRSTFVYNVVDLTGVKVTRVYSINGTDYYVSSVDWTDGYVNLYKMVWTTPVELFHQRAWLYTLDINFKAPYFVWPCSISAAYTNWSFYIADTYGLFKFNYNPQWFDKGYMKWWLYNKRQPYWVCFNQWYIYVSDETWCWKMRAYDTWKDWYQTKWILISREYEGKEWGTVTKMLDEVRMNYELNPLTQENGSIDIYVSPNNLWVNTDPEYQPDWWYKVMHIDQTNAWTRTEKTNLFNNLESWDSAFKFDWQTITYCIVIKTNNSEIHATPIVRQLDLEYHTKWKTNKVYNIK